ncbi:hypothetical protein QE152_g24452 [Popillia japonica]|uniref:Uncharacterized protein n=1 Tax=Popillia japonica TaxID=7064 RepID=A0AAW1KFV7_POPJA
MCYESAAAVTTAGTVITGAVPPAVYCNVLQFERTIPFGSIVGSSSVGNAAYSFRQRLLDLYEGTGYATKFRNHHYCELSDRTLESLPVH